jgi:hypothetical protein
MYGEVICCFYGERPFIGSSFIVGILILTPGVFFSVSLF